jgi:predicted kinase
MEDEKKSKKDKKKNDAVVKNTIEINPKLEEDVSPTAVFSFGRMNPPTIGHEKLVAKINAVAKQNNAMPHLYLSQSYDSNKNPLPYATKIALAKKAFGNMVMKSRSKTLMQVAKELEDMGHTKLIMVAGSDRVEEFKTLLNKYNGKDYTFDSIEVVSAGERDPDAEGVAGMSASKMRAAAAAGDEKAFKSGLPKKLQSSASKVYQAVRDGMKIAEEMEQELGEDLMFEAVLSVAARRKRAMAFKKAKSKIMRGRKIAAKKMASPEKLKLRSRKKAIEVIRKKVAGAKGTDYKNLSPSEKMSIDKKVEKKKGLIAKIAKKQFQKVKQAEKERLAKVRSGPAKESVNEAVAPEVKKGDTITVSKSERQYKMGGIVDPKTKVPSESDKMVVQKITKSSKGRKAHLTYQDSKKRGGYAIYLDDMPDFMSVTVESVNEEFENLFEREDKDIGDREGSQPAKYHSGLAKSTKQKRDAQFRKAAEKDSDDPSAYPDKHAGDSDAKTKTSKHTKRYHQMFGKENTVKHDQRFKRYRVNMVKPVELDEKGFIEEVDYMLNDVLNEMFEEVIVEKSLEGLKKKSEKSGIPYGILKKVYDRGMAAWRTGHRPGAGQEQWAYARVNSFITKGKGTWGKADADLAAKVRGEEVDLGEGAVDTARAAIKREKEADKKKHDAIMDRARLADTKATNRKEEVDIDEGVNDPGIFKAVFLAGGPGSGKSFVVGKTALTALGLKLINSDDAFEAQLKKVGLKPTPEDIFSPKGQEVRARAVALTGMKQKLALNGRLGLVIDGTGKDYTKIKRQADELTELGYDIAMIFVNTDLKTAQARNKKRERTLPEDQVEKMWDAVQRNIGRFQKKFKQDFIVIDNSEGVRDFDAATMSAYKRMSAWVKKTPKRSAAKQWIRAAQAEKQRGMKEANSWRTDGHYLENGEEWDGDQHAYEGEVYTGAEHGPDSKRLYHYKELSPSIRAKIDAALKEDNRENIQVGDFETKHFDMCPSAVALYKKLEPTDEVVKSAKLHDTLFGIEKEVIETETATQDDLDTAKKIAAQIMSMAKTMDKEEEHNYIQSHIDKIAEYVKDVKEEKEEVDHDKCGTPDCCGQCDTATDDVNEAFNAMISDTMFQEQQVKAGFKSSDDVDESRIGFMLNKDKYKQAAKLVKKEKEKDKTGRHSNSYWAAEVIRMNNLKLDPRLLAKLVDEEYGAGEEGTDELNAKYKKDTPGQ